MGNDTGAGFGGPRPAQARRLGRVLYGAGLRMQAALAERVRRGGPDQLLLLEHNPVFTLGRNASRSDIHAPDGFLAENGVEVHQTDRGGQVTYHGPGQIVAYPICDLRGGRQSVSGLVRGLEQAMIGAAGEFGVRAERLAGHPGIWVETRRGWEKLGAVGIHIKRWVSTHGLAFNVAPGMEHFGWITPCGIADKGVCSLRTLLGEGCPSWDSACASLERPLLRSLALDPVPAAEPSRSVSVAVWRRGANGLEILAPPRPPGEGRPWSSVAGAAGPGEALEAAARRKVMEETGLAGEPADLGLSHTFLADPSGAGVGEPLFNTEACFQMEVPAGAACARRDLAWTPAAPAAWPWRPPAAPGVPGPRPTARGLGQTAGRDAEAAHP
jgi:lipoyl(octanoyl) transferase